MTRPHCARRKALETLVILAMAADCGGRVDLGGHPRSNAGGGFMIGDASTESGGAQTPTVLLPLHDAWFCRDLAVDDTYIYLSVNESAGSSLSRCRKDDCAATLTRIREPSCLECMVHNCSNCPTDEIERVGTRLALAHHSAEGGHTSNRVHFDSCTLPDCADFRLIIDGVPDFPSYVYDAQHLFFAVAADRTLYSCLLPNCDSGPQVIAKGIDPTSVALGGAEIYWTDREGHVSRTRVDGSAPVESFKPGTILENWAADGGTTGAVTAGQVAIAENWLYAVGSDCRTDLCPQAAGLFRWPMQVGAARQTLVAGGIGPSPSVFSQGTAIDLRRGNFLLLDGEVVFALKEGGTWSCRADDCPATRRLIDVATPNRVVSDDEFLYWCFDSADGLTSGVRRLPRLPH